MRAFLASSLFLSLVGCRAAPPPPAETARPEGRATAMPENLRCRSAQDCAPAASCYWAEPSCVASSTVEPLKCGDDADPPDAGREKFTCGCQQGQCVARTE